MSRRRQKRPCKEARQECGRSLSCCVFVSDGSSRRRRLVIRDLPGHAEANVSDTDATVNEQDRKARQRQKPSENGSTIVCQVDEGQAAEQELQDDHGDGAAFLIDLGQKCGCHTYGHSQYECASQTKDRSRNSPFAARAWMVRVEPKVQEFATLMTAIRMTALKIEGRTLMPAS